MNVVVRYFRFFENPKGTRFSRPVPGKKAEAVLRHLTRGRNAEFSRDEDGNLVATTATEILKVERA